MLYLFQLILHLVVTVCCMKSLDAVYLFYILFNYGFLGKGFETDNV